jgi:hypothetical protein
MATSNASQTYYATKPIIFDTSYNGISSSATTSKTTGSITYNLSSNATTINLAVGTYSVCYFARPLAYASTDTYGMALYLNGSTFTYSIFGGTSLCNSFGQTIIIVSSASTLQLVPTLISAGSSVPFYAVPGAGVNTLCSVYIQRIA